MMPKTPPHPPGADLNLGGDAWCHPDLRPILAAITHLPETAYVHPPLTPYPGNPRRGDQDAITASIRDLGLYRPIIIQRSTGHVLAGNHTLRALLDLGATHVPVTWLDVDDTRAAAVVARDNLTSNLGTEDPADLLALLTSATDVLALSGYADEDLAALRRATEEPAPPPEYTRKSNALIYEPTMEEPPPVETLVDRTKANALIRSITEAEPPKDVRDFLIAAAQRHLVFDYARIAEWYAHATPEVQRLMESSALVIPDLEDAIADGFVRLSTRLAGILDADLHEREAQDAAGVPYRG